MKNTIQTIESKNILNRIFVRKKISFIRIFALAAVLIFSGLYQQTHAQEVIKQPVHDVTTTAKHYTYFDALSADKHKIIEYILVLSSKNEVKSTFNACDVCYPYHKGYSQKGTKLRCNNCGNTFDIDSLGNQGAGGCWPGHLVHSIEGDSVVITISDLKKGEYYFLEEVTEVAENDEPAVKVENFDNYELHIDLGDEFAEYLKIYTYNGFLMNELYKVSGKINMNISEFPNGVFFAIAKIDGKPVTRSFYISR